MLQLAYDEIFICLYFVIVQLELFIQCFSFAYLLLQFVIKIS